MPARQTRLAGRWGEAVGVLEIRYGMIWVWRQIYGNIGKLLYWFSWGYPGISRDIIWFCGDKTRIDGWIAWITPRNNLIFAYVYRFPVYSPVEFWKTTKAGERTQHLNGDMIRLWFHLTCSLGWVTSYNVLIFYGMNIHDNQLFWCSWPASKVYNPTTGTTDWLVIFYSQIQHVFGILASNLKPFWYSYKPMLDVKHF